MCSAFIFACIRSKFDAVKMPTFTVAEDGAATGHHYIALPQETDNDLQVEDQCEPSQESPQQLGLKPLDLLRCSPFTRKAGMFKSCIPGLHMAAREGKVKVMREIMDNCPESLMERQVPSDETPLHVAVRYGRRKAIKFLVEWLRESPYFFQVVNQKDSSGDTVLHLATSRKQLQTLKLLLDCNPAYSGEVEVNAKNNHGFTALDFLHVLPEGGKIDMEMDKLLRRAGALRGRDLVERQRQETGNNEVVIELGNRCHSRYPRKAIHSNSFIISCYTTLLLATLFAAITYHAALRPVGRFSSEVLSYDSSKSFQVRRQAATSYHLFVLFNSVSFFTSLGMIAILLHDLPLFPWLQVSISSSSAAYVCAVMANSAQEVTTVLLVGSSVMLVAIFKCLAMDKMVLHVLDCLFIRYLKIYK